MKPGTRILFSNEDTQDAINSKEHFWGVIKDTIVEVGSTAYLTMWKQPNEQHGPQDMLTIVRPRQIEMIED